MHEYSRAVKLRGILVDQFSTQSRNLFRHLSESSTNLFNPVCYKSRPCPLSQFLATVFTSLSEENQDWVTNLGCIGEAPDFPHELLQLFLSFASSMGIVMQEDEIITQHARAFMSDYFTMAQ
ncbi:hypothetical protein AVEN_217147-1 [Araneus ventricosus]|uniref:Uncharacterized protein n=1 Tax=Araneus ventricosus TaxID=182803 RepID=A0A4Y2ABM4_ARAVE|nr:hypothetical protein AVEN_217147-1 [Araneus ventricosus]